jgi:hypothetical protein
MKQKDLAQLVNNLIIKEIKSERLKLKRRRNHVAHLLQREAGHHNKRRLRKAHRNRVQLPKLKHQPLKEVDHLNRRKTRNKVRLRKESQDHNQYLMIKRNPNNHLN